MDFPAILFKFSKPEHASSLVDLGEVGVGTLAYYREGFEPEVVPLRGDKDEGIVYVKGEIENFEVSRTMPDAAAKYEQLKRGVGIDAPGARISIRNMHVDASFKVNNPLYIYCTSMGFDEAQLARFGGACVEIVEPREFWSTLGDALILGAHARHARPVQYVDSRTFDPLGVPALNAIWMKPKGDYGPQNEFRMAFELASPPPKPFHVLRCEALRKHCRHKS